MANWSSNGSEPLSPAPSYRRRHYAPQPGRAGSWELPPFRTMRELREAAGLTLRELGRRCGLHSPTLSLIERGRLVPTDSELAAIAEGLGAEAGSLSVRLLVVQEVEG